MLPKKFRVDVSDLTVAERAKRKISRKWVTPHFRADEFDCNDDAKTPYVAGLVKYENVKRLAAYRRRKSLALRCEEVRARLGGKSLTIVSAYRTPAHNKSIPGSATNSAHLRGYAVDIAAGKIRMPELHAAVQAAFEGGVGYYPKQRFVHGDFDQKLGLARRWRG